LKERGWHDFLALVMVFWLFGHGFLGMVFCEARSHGCHTICILGLAGKSLRLFSSTCTLSISVVRVLSFKTVLSTKKTDEVRFEMNQKEEIIVSRREVLKLSAAGVSLAALPGVLLAGAEEDITGMTAVELSVAIKSRQVSCVEVMNTFLARIERVNPDFNAIVSLRSSEELLAEAKTCDDELNAGHYRGWMHGMPHAAKDLVNVKGLPTTRGSPIFKDNVVQKDSLHIARIRNAGAVFVGKTNVPEFGLGSHTYNNVFGASLNPYDGKSTPGGSSGGAAAALRLNLVPVADGSDLMGSLRNPAAFCNVIGFRPGPGVVPLTNNFMEELPCNGPMARNVTDTAKLLSTMAGYDRRYPKSVPIDPATYAAPLKRDFKGTRIGWLGDFNGYLATEPGVLDVCTKALGSFRDIGCEVDEADLGYPMDKLWQTWLTFRHWLNRNAAAPIYADESKLALLKPEMVWEIENGLKLTARDIFQASVARAEWYSTLVTAFDKYDYLVLPTAQVFPFSAETHWPKEINGLAMDTYHRWMEIVIMGTLSGCPVINVPAGFGKKGLPMGLQIIAPRHHDFSALQVAYAYEQASRWNLGSGPVA
jgi:amidase